MGHLCLGRRIHGQAVDDAVDDGAAGCEVVDAQPPDALRSPLRLPLASSRGRRRGRARSQGHDGGRRWCWCWWRRGHGRGQQGRQLPLLSRGLGRIRGLRGRILAARLLLFLLLLLELGIGLLLRLHGPPERVQRRVQVVQHAAPEAHGRLLVLWLPTGLVRNGSIDSSIGLRWRRRRPRRRLSNHRSINQHTLFTLRDGDPISIKRTLHSQQQQPQPPQQTSRCPFASAAASSPSVCAMVCVLRGVL